MTYVVAFRRFNQDQADPWEVLAVGQDAGAMEAEGRRLAAIHGEPIRGMEQASILVIRTDEPTHVGGVVRGREIVFGWPVDHKELFPTVFKSDLDALAAWEMGDLAPRTNPSAQPPPQPTEISRPVWPALEADLGALPRTLVPDALLARLAERAEQGRRKYGTELHTHDGRDPWQDAGEEVLDALFYACRLRLLGGLTEVEYSHIRYNLLNTWAILQGAKARQGAKS